MPIERFVLGGEHLMIDYAKIYLEHGLNIIPLKFKDKTPVIEWKPFQSKLAEKRMVEVWFSIERNIGIICGSISKNLIVIDFDDREIFAEFYNLLDEDLKAKVDSTWVVATSRGLHVYFRIPYPFKTQKIESKIDIKGEGSYVVAPPSVHPDGTIYMFRQGPPEYSIQNLNENEWRRMLSVINTILGEQMQEQHETKKTLKQEQINELFELLRPYYKKGYRDWITFYFSGLCLKNNINEESVKRVIEMLANATNDEEFDQRMRVVEYHYQGREIPLEKFKGVSGLKDILEMQLMDLNEEERLQKVSETLNRIYNILGVEHNRPGTAWVTRIGGKLLSWSAIGKTGIYLFRRQGDDVIITHLTSARPQKITRIKIIGTNLTAYSLKFEHEEINGNLKEILQQIEERYGLDTKHKHAIERLIETAAEEEEEAYYSAGPWVINGRIMLANKGGYTPSWKTDFEWNIQQTNIKEPLMAVKKFVESYKKPERVSLILSYAALAPIAYYIKKVIGIFPHLIIHGLQESGKSAVLDMLMLIYNIQEKEPLPTTDYQTRKILATTTLPAIIDEIRQLMENYQSERKSAYDVIEILHRAATQERLRSAGGSQYAGEYLAIRSIIAATNTDISLVPWMRDKFILVEISKDEKIDVNKARGATANTMKNDVKQAMQGIGYAILRKLESKLPEIEALRGETREDISKRLIQIGYKIWKELYEENGLEPFVEPMYESIRETEVNEYEDTFIAYLRKCMTFEKGFPMVSSFTALDDQALIALEQNGAIIYEAMEGKKLICKTIFLSKYQQWANKEYNQQWLGWRRLSEILNMQRNRRNIGGKTIDNLLERALDFL
jgi:hypothetical protein